MRSHRLIAAALVWLALCIPTYAAQDDLFSPTTGTVSGLQLTNNYNSALAALASCNSGASAPNNLESGPVEGQCWLDTSASPHTVRIYDGAQWVAVFKLDTTNHLLLPQIGGGNATLASATTTDLCSVAQNALTISGTTTITGLGASCQTGQIKALTFSGILTLTHNATSLILPTGASITTAAGDTALSLYLGGGNWKVLVYARASGTALSTTANFTGSVSYQSPIAITLASNTNDWAPAGFSAANRVRLTCSSAINITGLTGGSDGRRVIIENVGSNGCTLTANDSASTAANRFLIAGAYLLAPNQSTEVVYDGTVGGWRIPSLVTAAPISGGFRSLTVTNVATAAVTAPATPNKQMKIVADAITVETSAGLAYRLAAVSVTPNLTASGANGLDTGSVAPSTWYFSYVIYNPTGGGTAGGLWSTATSCAGVLLPSGYTACARVGANVTDSSSNLMRVAQYGRRAHYAITAATNTLKGPTIVQGAAGTYNGTSPTLSTQSVASVVPITAAAIQLLATSITGNLLAANILIAPSAAWGGTDNGPTSGANRVVYPYFSSGAVTAQAFWLPLEATTIGYASDNTGAAVNCLGWEDNL